MAVTMSDRLLTVGRGRDRDGLMPVSRKIGDPIKLGTPVPYYPENRGPHPQFFGNLGIPHPYISRNLGIPL